jgi:hypothetical protein
MEDINMILAAYSDAASRPGGTRLEEWVRRYPQHERALVQYALYNFLFEQGGAAAEPTPAEETLFLERAAMIRKRMMQSRTQAASSWMGDLIEAAKKRGLTVPALAERLHLTPVEIVKLNQRLIRASTIPNALVQQLATLLGRSREEVASYLQLPPTLSANASYRSAETPRVQRQQDFLEALCSLTLEQRIYWQEQAEQTQDFRDALRDNPDLSDEQRDYWLERSEEPQDDRER